MGEVPNSIITLTELARNDLTVAGAVRDHNDMLKTQDMLAAVNTRYDLSRAITKSPFFDGRWTDVPGIIDTHFPVPVVRR